MSNFHTELVRRVELNGISRNLTGTCKNVLTWIAYHANEEEADIAYPGIETLELETGLGRRAIIRATEELAKHEWITKRRRSGTSNIYRINVRKLRQNYLPKAPSKINKLIQELPGLTFSDETETDIQDLQTPEDTPPDQPLCLCDTSLVSYEHDRRAAATCPSCSSDTQTIREGSGNQPTTHDEHADASGWVDGEQPQDTTATTKTSEDSRGHRYLRELVFADGTGFWPTAVNTLGGHVTNLIESGWTEEGITAAITDTAGMERPRNWPAFARRKLESLHPVPAASPNTSKPQHTTSTWCGECGDPSDPRRETKCRNNVRMRVWPDGTLCACARSSVDTQAA